MDAEEQIINRVATSSLVTFDLENFYTPGERVLLDISHQLYEGLILKEKDFRQFIKEKDWTEYKDKLVAITCSADAIVPTWAFMLIGLALQPHARKFIMGSLEDLEIRLFLDELSKVNWAEYSNARVVVKGCSKIEVPTPLYVEVIARIRPFAVTLMFGEPCSTVPLYKRKEK
jgi:hypothetical protein